MKKLTQFLYSLSLLVFSHAIPAYEVPTHEDMSEMAAFSSVLIQPEIFSSLGFIGGIDDPKLKLPNSKGEEKTIRFIIRDGANFEDNNIRPLNHFFDPTTDTGLLFTSPTWALEDKGQISVLQAYSYTDARQHLYDALTKTEKAEREKSFGSLFETLGRVIHHIQDMAQPQHVRLDTHLKFSDADKPDWFFEKGSRYEAYTLDKGINLPFTGYAPVYSDTDATPFTTPRKFWTTTTGVGNGGKGIAEYTNRGFFSAGTNADSGKYNFPAIDPTTGKDENIAVLCAQVNPPCPPGLSGTMTFFGNMVTDTLRPADTRANPRATTHSIFDQDLVKKAGASPVFSLNRFNFDAAHEFLIPRAVAYSAGLINYFFRGKIDFVPDPDKTGSYRIKNLGNEDMSGVFALYYDAVDGKRHKVPGASWNVQVVKNGQSNPLIFSPPTSPVPKTSNEYLLVFSGDMGEEKAGTGVVGAVTGKIVRPSLPGFIFLPGDMPSDGIGGTRLIYRDNGLWKLSKEAGLAAGNIDWKGGYVNGKPTRVITWKGPRSRYFPTSDESPGNFSVEIYQNGKLFSVAPAPVLGAALTKDAAGNEWLVVICQTAGGDMVYRRPNTPSTASDLYDPVNAPAGWQHIATLANPPDTLGADRAWLFNGNGTEAQTLRRKTYDPVRGAELTRLKMTINGTSASRIDLGNSTIKASSSTSWSNQNCEWYVGDGPSPLVHSKAESLSAGETVVAVDYRDSQEILAKIVVNNSRSRVINGASSESMGQQSDVTNYHESRMLRFGGMEIILENTRGLSDSLATWGGFTRTDRSTTETSHLLFLDLRGDLAIYRRFVDQSDGSRSAPDPLPGTRVIWSATSVGQEPEYQLRHGASVQTFYSYPYNLSRNGEYSMPGGDRYPTYLIDSCFDNSLMNGSDTVTSTREYQEALSVSSKDGSVAIDRDGSVFVSTRYLDENDAIRHFNFLEGGDPAVVTGITNPNPAFYEIAPK